MLFLILATVFTNLSHSVFASSTTTTTFSTVSTSSSSEKASSSSPEKSSTTSTVSLTSSSISTTTTSLSVTVELKPEFLSLVAQGDEVSVFEAMKQLAFLQSNSAQSKNTEHHAINTAPQSKTVTQYVQSNIQPAQLVANTKTLCIYLGKSIQLKPKHFLWALRKYRKDLKDPSCPLTYLGPSYNGNLKGRRAILQLRIDSIKKVSTRELTGAKSESLNILRAAFRSTPPVE